jgi:hypothetical protein
MANEKPPRINAMPNDCSVWGEKDVRAYSSPLRIAGELVLVEELPPFGEIDKQPPLASTDKQPTGT